MTEYSLREYKVIKGIAWIMLLMCMMVLVRYILVKGGPDQFKRHFEEQSNSQMIKNGIKRANFIPFASLKYFYSVRRRVGYVLKNVLGNIIGFIPLGILLPFLFRNLNSAWKTIVAVFLISLAFETTQLVFNLGIFDVDDLLLNTLGGAIGYLVFAFSLRYVK
jgi:glycopeptide antibiotics resistance protein